MAGLLQYAPWTSDIELAFYSALASLKINHDKLDSSARKVLGLYEINYRDAPERSTRMQIHGSALTTDDIPSGYYRGEGIIRNFNTIEEYRQTDKAAHIERAGRTIWDAINDGTIYSCPSLLSSFSAICFADLKKYKFTYHIAYPALHSDPSWKLSPGSEGNPKRLSVVETTALVEKVQTWKYSVDNRQHGFFLARKIRKSMVDEEPTSPKFENMRQGGDSERPVTPGAPDPGFIWSVSSLASYETGFYNDTEPEDRYVCFVDPSTYPNNPGWMLRNLLVLIRQRFKLDSVQILCYRDTHLRREQPSSIVLDLQIASPSSSAVKQESSQQPPQLPKITGWERNDQNKIVARTVDLAAYLDPARLADQAVDLNLKLIKWRIAPSIDLDIIKHTSCLLLGAGTLGSYVARNLMGWGARKITFVDNGRVSYSNPVRQPLYDFKDCLNGGAQKAERAAEALQEIYPGVDSVGHVMSVPMAGHPITEEAKVKQDFDHLHKLIQDHDAIFLLMDTRESRWLPTVMAKALGKIVINAALGFDTYMVMRHGVRLASAQSPTMRTTPEKTYGTRPPRSNTSSEGEELGCYFCSDVVAPADSLKSATLDQQCTVTRPGVAPLASALAVELLVSILQSPLGPRVVAPSPPNRNTSSSASVVPVDSSDDQPPHPLGTVPHQLRGFLSNWSNMVIKGKAYDCCSACSPPILEAYEKDRWEFVRRAINEKGFVEEVSGLAEVQRRAEEADGDVDWSEGEDDEEEEIV